MAGDNFQKLASRRAALNQQGQGVDQARQGQVQRRAALNQQGQNRARQLRVRTNGRPNASYGGSPSGGVGY